MIALLVVSALYCLIKPDLYPKQDFIAMISGTMASFLISTLAIIQILAPDRLFSKQFLESKHSIVLARSAIIGVMASVLCIMSYLLGLPVEVIVIIFIIGITEWTIAGWYIFKIIKHLSEDERR